MGISGQTIWRQTGNFLLTQKIIRKITYYEPGLSHQKDICLQDIKMIEEIMQMELRTMSIRSVKGSSV